MRTLIALLFLSTVAAADQCLPDGATQQPAKKGGVEPLDHGGACCSQEMACVRASWCMTNEGRCCACGTVPPPQPAPKLGAKRPPKK